jgi:hypothetical protein
MTALGKAWKLITGSTERAQKQNTSAKFPVKKSLLLALFDDGSTRPLGSPLESCVTSTKDGYLSMKPAAGPRLLGPCCL